MNKLFDVEELPEKNSKSNEWYTPHIYIEAARAVMGAIDLDPASCELANRTVKAARYYTKEDNGLEQPLYGRVWCNPPYGKLSNKSMLEVWVMKLIREYESGNVEQAILLATTNTEAPWFAHIWDYPLCFVDHEVRFLSPQGIRKCHLFGTTISYLGPNISSFVEHFTEFGPVVTPDGVHRRPAPVQQPTLWDKEISI